MSEKLVFVIFLCMAAIHAAPSHSVLQDKEKNPDLLTDALPTAESSTDELSDPDEFYYENGSDFEGDILLTPQAILGGGTGSSKRRWTNKKIPYIIDDAISSPGKKVIHEAIAEIHNKTCIRLIRRSSQENYVNFMRHDERCNSKVGMAGGAQPINLTPHCYRKRTVVHEIIHAIGFHHEQTRSDRDDYITINWSNIPDKKHRNYKLHSDTNSFGSPYEYESIMHYSAYSNAIDKTIPTITSKAGTPPKNLGRGDGNGGMTDTDAAQINRMYGC